MTTISLGLVIATDEIDNEFVKEVMLYQEEDKLVLDFGSFAKYNLSDLQNGQAMQASDNEKFLLDMMGRNHKGSPVSITVGMLRSLVGVARVVAATKFTKTSGLYDVYYARDPHFIDSGSEYGPPLYTVAALPETHEFIRTIEAADIDEVYRLMQSENWEPRGNILASILSLEKPHTSMSANDVVRDSNGDYYECLIAGWRKLE